MNGDVFGDVFGQNIVLYVELTTYHQPLTPSERRSSKILVVDIDYVLYHVDLTLAK